jgi:hypothetical protein
MPVEGEYCLSTNELRNHGEIALGAADKIRTPLEILLANTPLRLISSNLSISGHNSPILILDDTSGVPPPPSAQWESFLEEKIDRSQELEISITSLGVSRSITPKPSAGPHQCGTYAGKIHYLSF